MRTADAELFQDKIEVSLDGRQIFYLFFGGAVVACLVFVLGVMVGQRLEARARVAAPPADGLRDPLAALDQLNAREAAGELSFPAVLAGDAPVDDPLLSNAMAHSGGAKAGAGQRKASAASKSSATPTQPAKIDDSVSAGPAKTEARPGAEPEPSVPSRARGPAASSVATPVATPVATTEAKFTLQTSSFQDRGEAEAFYAKLAGDGYKPYIVEAEVADKGTWFRVRLGKFTSYDDAIAAKKKFESDQHIIAYVTRL